jgi:SAM-dependent methyltransferase
MVHHTSCPLCSSGDLTFHLSCRDLFLTGEPFDLYRCISCSFIFTQDHPGEKEMVRYYNTAAYVSHDDSGKGFIAALYRMVRRFTLASKRKLIIRLTGKTTGKLLDIGTGSGHFAGTMKQAGWKVTGIEPDRKTAEYAASRFGLKICGPGEVTGLPGETFDCITLWHSLEHSHNLHHYASEIKRLLKPEGICIVALPSAASFDARYYGEFWAAYDVPRHLWHFTPITLKSFAEKSGFYVTGKKSLPLDVFYISFLSEKYRGANLPFLSGFLKGAWFSFISLLTKRGSSSMICILQVRSA